MLAESFHSSLIAPANEMPELTIMKSERKRLRRKLQKIGPDPSAAAARISRMSSVSSAFAAFSPNKRLRINSEDRSDFQAVARKSQPRLQLPTDLRDHEWLKDLQGTGYFYPDPNSKRKSEIHPLFRGEPIPEFAHLALHDQSQDLPVTTDDFLPPTRTLGSRRYAKTPVTRIGQLEDRSTRTPAAAPRGSSAELIAESYRALLQTPHSLLKDSCADLRARQGSVAPDSVQTPARCFSPSLNSPISDDGTLVGFEEDTIFFKPISFTPEPSVAAASEPPSPAIRDEPQITDEEPMSDNPALQICFNLLTQELTSASRGGFGVDSSTAGSPSHETSALQIWVMIEAYEKLRDQILAKSGNDENASQSTAMFDTWLKALYAIHDDMMEKKKELRLSSGSTQCDNEFDEYGGMIPEDLD